MNDSSPLVDRLELILASFAAAGPGAAFDPVRVQELLSLVDREVSDQADDEFRSKGPYFRLNRKMYRQEYDLAPACQGTDVALAA